MRAKIKLSLTAIVFVLLFIGVYGFIIEKPDPPPNRTYLVIVKDSTDGVWKVVELTNPSNKKIKVYRNEFVYWTAVGTDAYLQFPDSIFAKSKDIEDGFTAVVKDGDWLKLKVKGTAVSKTYIYSVFCSIDSVYAKGGSPPEFDVH